MCKYTCPKFENTLTILNFFVVIFNFFCKILKVNCTIILRSNILRTCVCGDYILGVSWVCLRFVGSGGWVAGWACILCEIKDKIFPYKNKLFLNFFPSNQEIHHHMEPRLHKDMHPRLHKDMQLRLRKDMDPRLLNQRTRSHNMLLNLHQCHRCNHHPM